MCISLCTWNNRIICLTGFWEENQDFGTCGHTDLPHGDTGGIVLVASPFSGSKFPFLQEIEALGQFWVLAIGVQWFPACLGPFGTGTVLICSCTLSSLMSKNGIIDCFRTKRDFGAARGCTWCVLGLSSGTQIAGELGCGFSWKGSFLWRLCAATVTN